MTRPACASGINYAKVFSLISSIRHRDNRKNQTYLYLPKIRGGVTMDQLQSLVNLNTYQDEILDWGFQFVR